MKLCRVCSEFDEEIIELINECSRLMPFGVQVRYPNNTDLFEEDMQTALEDAEKIRKLILPKIQMTLVED